MSGVAGLSERQAFIDQFYLQHGPCCAGCDWWRSYNTRVGECQRTTPRAGPVRYQMLGVENASLKLGAGHIFTRREHLCGEFKDDFDWNSLPAWYRRKVGTP